MFELRGLEPSDVVTGLSLGHPDFEPLKRFFRQEAKLHQAHSLARTYVIVKKDTPNKPIAYMTLVSGHVTVEDASLIDPIEFKYKEYPAVKLARLAVDRRHRGSSFGSDLVSFAIALIKESICPSIGCRFLVVDSKQQSIGFYKRMGFNMIDTDQNRGRGEPVMFMDLHKISL